MTGLEIAPDEWLQVFERDYLATFVRQGGAATKVLVAVPEVADRLVPLVRAAAERNGMLAAHVDQSVHRVYHMDRLFNVVARQLEWPQLASDFMSSALRSHGYDVPDGARVVEDIAALNSLDVAEVRITCEQVLSSSIMKDHTMALDFRLAMNQLCRAAVERDDLLAESAGRVLDWLRGDLRTIGSLRPAMIFERINRYNARSMFTSLGEWLRLAGRAGLLVVVDVSRFASGKSAIGPDGLEMRAPSRAAVMDTYEMMRQCIDGTDEMAGVMICFLTGPEFVQDDKRGMRAYSALEQRLAEDVHDRVRANPYAPMVRMAGPWS